MYRSFGIDNVFLLLRLPSEAIETLIRRCRGTWLEEDNTKTYLLLGTRFNPKITLSRIHGKVIVNLNIPKCNWEHNLRLAGPREIKRAFKKFEVNSGLRLDDAEAIRVDLCLCEETKEAFDESLSLLECPRGFKKKKMANGCYYTEKHGRVSLLAYCKSAQLIEDGVPIPDDVLAECESDKPTIIRYELRIGNSDTLHLAGSELRRLRLWTSPFVLGSDLCANSGFHALTNYYERFMLKNVELGSVDHTRRQKPPKTLNALKARAAIRKMDLHDPEHYLLVANELHQSGAIGSNLFELARVYAESLIYQKRVRRLASTIREICSSIRETYPVKSAPYA